MLFRDAAQGAAKAACLTLLLAGLGWGAASPAEAASAAAVRAKPVAVTPVAEKAKEPETTGSVEKAVELEPNCAQSRKRLWVEGEGWVVRRVTTCF